MVSDENHFFLKVLGFWFLGIFLFVCLGWGLEGVFQWVFCLGCFLGGFL